MNGKVMGKEYEYALSGFDKEGKENELEFIVQKNLRKEAFLRGGFAVFYYMLCCSFFL